MGSTILGISTLWTNVQTNYKLILSYLIREIFPYLSLRHGLLIVATPGIFCDVEWVRASQVRSCRRQAALHLEGVSCVTVHPDLRDQYVVDIPRDTPWIVTWDQVYNG